jgi:hypothetical protein
LLLPFLVIHYCRSRSKTTVYSILPVDLVSKLSIPDRQFREDQCALFGGVL